MAHIPIRSDGSTGSKRLTMSLRGRLEFYQEWTAAAQLASAVVHETFNELELVTMPIESDRPSLSSRIEVIDPYFNLDTVQPTDDFLIVISPCRLQTAFGYAIAGETRQKTVVISGPLLSSENAKRLIRHELGHVFGLDEHLECVMSPYYVEHSRFCTICVDALASRNVRLMEPAMAAKVVKVVR